MHTNLFKRFELTADIKAYIAYSDTNDNQLNRSMVIMMVYDFVYWCIILKQTFELTGDI